MRVTKRRPCQTNGPKNKQTTPVTKYLQACQDAKRPLVLGPPRPPSCCLLPLQQYCLLTAVVYCTAYCSTVVYCTDSRCGPSKGSKDGHTTSPLLKAPAQKQNKKPPHPSRNSSRHAKMLFITCERDINFSACHGLCLLLAFIGLQLP